MQFKGQENTMSLKLHACTISRRGKAAKGTVNVETFGVPVKPKKGNQAVTKKWSYSFVDQFSWRDCVDAVEQMGRLNQRLMKEALLRGRDLIIKSSSIQEQSERAGLIRFILESELALDKKTARNLASIWQQTQSFMKRSGMAVPTIEQLAEQRKVQISELIEKGLWVKLPDDEDETDDSDDSDDSDDDSEEDSE